jgi:quercetin dioxygenase-like cupin family protein
MKGSLLRGGDSSDPFVKAVPPAQRLLLKNRRVRVWEMVLPPGGSYPLHQHRVPYLSIMLNDATVVMTDPAGDEERLRVRAGDVVWRLPPDHHAVRNVGRTTFRNRLVELLA